MQHPVVLSLKSQPVAVSLTGFICSSRFLYIGIALSAAFSCNKSCYFISFLFSKGALIMQKKTSSHLTTDDRVRIEALLKEGCSHRHVCGSFGCRKKSNVCHKAKLFCSDYVKAQCDTLLNSPVHLCSSCYKFRYCHLEKRLYDAKSADREYRTILVNSLNGFDLTAGEF